MTAIDPHFKFFLNDDDVQSVIAAAAKLLFIESESETMIKA